MMNHQTELSFLNLLPGYTVTRSDFAQRRNLDAKQTNGSWLDGIGEMFFIDAERAFVIPAQELGYVSAEQLRAARLPRLVKLVASEDGGVNVTTTGHINHSWLSSFTKISALGYADTERHFVKAFAPTHQGAIIGYHAVRCNDGQLNVHTFEQVNGQQLRDIDFVSYEGKVHFTATTLAMGSDKSTCWVRECGIKALKANEVVNATWSPAAWTDGHQIANLRGTLVNGARMYTYLDIDQGALCQVQPNDKQAKVLKKNIKGMLNTVSGAHMGYTVITDDKIINLGKDEQVVCELSQNAELARLVQTSKWVSGIVARNGVAYLTSTTNPLCSVVSAQLKRIG